MKIQKYKDFFFRDYWPYFFIIFGIFLSIGIIFGVYSLIKYPCHNCIECPTKTPKEEQSLLQDIQMIYERQSYGLMAFNSFYIEKKYSKFCIMTCEIGCKLYVLYIPLFILAYYIICWIFQCEYYNSEKLLE